MNSTDTIAHKNIGFDNQKYLQLQQEAIRARLQKISSGTLYLEIGGKFLYDPHGQRVMPGFDAHVKPEIIKGLQTPYEIIFCINSQDIEENRMLTSKNEAFVTATLTIIAEYRKAFPVPFSVALNLVSTETPALHSFRAELANRGITSYIRYVIPGYPDPKIVVSENGYAKDEYIPTNSPLVLVIGPASNSGKMSTCLGQIYHDRQNGKESGYAKFELFPIWNLPLKHPVNIAYEAATADIGDFNLYDYHHENAYGQKAVNYNRDVEAFPIITGLLKEILPATSFMQLYKSPTDMGMNKAGFAITDNHIIMEAAIEEIIRRKEWYQTQLHDNHGKKEWVERCEELLQEARAYLAAKHDFIPS